jgi:hypothetical protein
VRQQISQQQAIYNQITNLAVRASRLFTIFHADDPFVKSSFDTLLKLHEVILHSKVTAVPTDVWTEIPSGEEQARVRYGTAEQAVFRRGR